LSKKRIIGFVVGALIVLVATVGIVFPDLVSRSPKVTPEHIHVNMRKHKKQLSCRLFEAVQFRRPDRVRQLLRKGADPNARDCGVQIQWGDDNLTTTSLEQAVSSKQVEIAGLLLKNGASFDPSNRNGQKVMRYIAGEKDLAMYQEFKKAGKSFEVAAGKESNVKSLLEHAAANGNQKLIEQLSHKETNTQSK